MIAPEPTAQDGGAQEDTRIVGLATVNGTDAAKPFEPQERGAVPPEGVQLFTVNGE